MGTLLGWDDTRRLQEIATYQQLAAEHAVPAD
jgi:hypothetical protein